MLSTRFGHLPDDDGARLCRACCSHLKAGGRIPGNWPRPSAQATALCQAFCTTFMRRRPMIAVRRSRHQLPTGAA